MNKVFLGILNWVEKCFKTSALLYQLDHVHARCWRDPLPRVDTAVDEELGLVVSGLAFQLRIMYILIVDVSSEIA